MLSKDAIRQKLVKVPDWILACDDLATDTVAMHQDAFAPDYRQAEIELLGWAIKYAGLCGTNVQVVAGKKPA
jgi:hypothetical protein